MYYFLTEQLAAQPSGIEHAQIKRLQLFKQNHVPAKIFTNAYDRFFHYHATINGLHEHDILNLFDWLQHAETYHGVKKMVKDIKAPGNYDTVITKNNYTDYLINNHVILRIIPFNFAAKQVSEVHFSAFNGQVVQKDFYDTRGFLSFTQFMDQNGGGVVSEVMYTPQHQPAVEKIYRHSGNQYPVTCYRIFNYAGNDWYFDNMNQLIRFVLDELNLKQPQIPDTLLADLDYVYDRPLTWLTTKTRNFLVWHNIHTVDPMNLDGPIYANYRFELDNATKFAGLIVPTQKQANDIKRRFAPKMPVITLPYGYVTAKQLTAAKIPLASRIRHKIIAVARIHPQKNLPDMIKAFQLIQQKIPDATLDIWGYTNDQKLLQQLQKQVADLNLTANVAFKGYSQNLDQVYDSAQLMLLTSLHEGNPLSLIEAFAHGVPIISYATNYGPAEVITPDVNGAVIPQGDYQQLAATAIKYLQDQPLLAQLSHNAYAARQTFSATATWQQWTASSVIQ
ncbi:glycosyltransferase [Loigolactobacillus jiayinensis]|uniref:Glycosyltransferase n=1 Tax=Loigolactobacillus jiayinensis TaxID=2486016 RepID=A0ABW1RH86_9LACO|nr:glycosyltransferase [Loigolactobacillus jiayinensis]